MMATETIENPMAEQRGSEDVGAEEEEVSDFVFIQ